VYRLILAALAVVALGACASQPPSQAGAESKPAAAQSSAPPVTIPKPAKVRRIATLSATPSPTPSATPSPSPSPQKKVVVPMRSSNAPPKIVDVEMNTSSVGSGDTLWGKVLTSSNVASVEVRVANIGVGLNKVGVGRFTLTYKLGSIPFFVHGTYPMRIIARNSRGDAVERTLPLTIH
jgi:hypothetical protein